MIDRDYLKQLWGERYTPDISKILHWQRCIGFAEQAGGLALRSWLVQDKVSYLTNNLLKPTIAPHVEIDLGIRDKNYAYLASFFLRGLQDEPMISFTQCIPEFNEKQGIGKGQLFPREFADTRTTTVLQFMGGQAIWRKVNWGSEGQKEVIDTARTSLESQEEALALFTLPLADPELNPHTAKVGQELLQHYPYV